MENENVKIDKTTAFMKIVVIVMLVGTLIMSSLAIVSEDVNSDNSVDTSVSNSNEDSPF